MERRDDAVHLVVDRGASGGVERRQRLVPEDAPGDELHHVEGAADDAFVFTQDVHAGHRYGRAGEAAHHRELAIDRMRRRQQLGRRPGLGAHDVSACRRQQLIGRIRLAALELLDGERAGEAGQVLAEVALERGDVEGVLFGDRLGAGVGFGRAHAAILSGWRSPAACPSRARRAASARCAPRLRARSPSAPG